VVVPGKGRSRGFTLVEMAVVVGIIATLTGLAYAGLARLRPRGELANTAADLQAALHGARLTAMAEGRNVVVMFFPRYQVGESVGRVILYQDGDFNFFSGAFGVPLTFGGYNPAVLASGPNSQVLDSIDLPKGVVIGPAAGMGPAATLAAPMSAVDVTRACSFCATTGDGRGALVFDSRGRVTYYDQNGPALSTAALASGASVSVFSADLQGTRTLVISTATGAVRAFNNG
jgi:prepilin-type N-terminal cleavage/methylation domain-containing protein